MIANQLNTTPINKSEEGDKLSANDFFRLGYFKLDCNPENYIKAIEQAAFDPTYIVPGIEFSPDKMLQGRLFSYGDAQHYRLGINHHQIPVKSPKHAPANPSHRDGLTCVDVNTGTTLAYKLNSFGERQEQPEFIKIHHIGNCLQADPAHRKCVADAMGI